MGATRWIQIDYILSIERFLCNPKYSINEILHGEIQQHWLKLVLYEFFFMFTLTTFDNIIYIQRFNVGQQWAFNKCCNYKLIYICQTEIWNRSRSIDFNAMIVLTLMQYFIYWSESDHWIKYHTETLCLKKKIKQNMQRFKNYHFFNKKSKGCFVILSPNCFRSEIQK